jgi:hypothetical protein
MAVRRYAIFTLLIRETTHSRDGRPERPEYPPTPVRDPIDDPAALEGIRGVWRNCFTRLRWYNAASWTDRLIPDPACPIQTVFSSAWIGQAGPAKENNHEANIPAWHLLDFS